MLNGTLMLASLFVQILIIAGLVILFLIVTILNYHTKAPKGVKLDEKCSSCTSTSCMIKLKDVEKMKKEIQEEIKEEINAEMHKCDKINLNENDLNNKINKENKDER